MQKMRGKKGLHKHTVFEGLRVLETQIPWGKNASWKPKIWFRE